jgi:hypothetical protein
VKKKEYEQSRKRSIYAVFITVLLVAVLIAVLSGAALLIADAMRLAEVDCYSHRCVLAVSNLESLALPLVPRDY